MDWSIHGVLFSCKGFKKAPLFFAGLVGVRLSVYSVFPICSRFGIYVSSKNHVHEGRKIRRGGFPIAL